MQAMLQFGLLPRTSKEKEEVANIIKDADSDGDGEFHFREFLVLIDQIRVFMMRQKSGVQRKLFQKHDRDDSGFLNITEISDVLVELKVSPSTRAEQHEIAQLMRDVDQDG